MLSQNKKRGKIKINLKWMMLLKYDLYISEHQPLKSNMEFYVFLLMLDSLPSLHFSSKNVLVI